MQTSYSLEVGQHVIVQCFCFLYENNNIIPFFSHGKVFQEGHSVGVPRHRRHQIWRVSIEIWRVISDLLGFTSDYFRSAVDGSLFYGVCLPLILTFQLDVFWSLEKTLHECL